MESRILLALGLAMAVTLVSCEQVKFSYKEAILLAISLFNQEPEVKLPFWLLEAKSQPEWVSGWHQAVAHVCVIRG